nr:sigma-70 family RNA polymerase sigma factor [Burkholderiaceae bacterium]
MAAQGYGPKLLYRRVQWRALDRLRGGRLPIVDVELTTIASNDPGPEQLLEGKRARQAICERIGSENLALLELSAEQSDDDTAKALGITKPALRKARSRARNKLLGVSE